MMSEKELLILSIKDFFTPKMIKFSLLPFIITLISMYLIFIIIASIGIEQLHIINFHETQTYMQNGVEHTENISTKIQGSDIMAFLSSYALTSWIGSFLIYAIGGFLTLYASIFVTVIVIGFLTPLVMKELQKRHYNDVEMIGHSNIISSIISTIKWAIVMLVLFIILVPFYFIPILNIIALNFPLYYFFHKMLTLDISSNICSAEEDRHIRYFSKNSIRAKTLGLYVVSLIPFVIFFGAIFYVIYLSNTYFLEVKKIRAI